MAGFGRIRAAVGVRGASVVASAALVVGLAPATAAPVEVANSVDITIPATMRKSPGTGELLSVGPSGYLHWGTTGLPSGLDWTSYDGTTQRVPGGGGAGPSSPIETYGAGSDIVALPPKNGSGDVQMRNMATGESWVVSVPAGQIYTQTFGDTVVTRSGIRTGSGWTGMHVLRAENGSTVDRPVTGLPDGFVHQFLGRGGQHGSLILGSVPDDTSSKRAWLDFRTATATMLPSTVVGTDSTVTAHHVVTSTGAGGVRIYEQGKFDAPVRELKVDLTDAKVVGVVGDSLIIGRHDPALGPLAYGSSTYRVVAVPFDGSPERHLLARASVLRIAHRPDGGLLIVGGSSALDYGFNIIAVQEDGTPGVEPLRRIAPVPMKHLGLVVDRGAVTSVEDGDGRTAVYERMLSDTAPGYGDRVRRGSLAFPYDGCVKSERECPRLHPTGDGRVVYMAEAVPEGGETRQERLFVADKVGGFPGTSWDTGLDPKSSDLDVQVLGVSGSLALVKGRSSLGDFELRVLDINSGRVLRKEPGLVGALWGTTFWTAAPAGDGTFTATAKEARTGARLTSVRVGSTCQNLFELQAVGQWLYWRCDGTPSRAAGVYDLVNRRNVPLGDTRTARLGNGIVVTGGDGKSLDVHDVRGATAVVENVATAHGLFSLDVRTGDLAYTLGKGAVRVLRRGLSAVPLNSPYSAVGTTVETDATPVVWRGEWWLNEPAADWTVTIRHPLTGRVVSTQTGGRAEYSIAASWNGRAADGTYSSNGRYTWTLTARPADGQGTGLVASGSVTLTGGAPVLRDHGSDGIGDLVSLSSSGALAFRYGNGAGGLSGAATGSGWSTSVVAVPFGDLNGDRCNDVLVRLGAELRAYKPKCGAALTPSTPYTSLGTVWAQFNVLTSPGDLTGDGRPDLVARQASTGDMYLYADDGAGKLKARGRIGTNWKLYRAIFGAGDLNGDGIGELLAVDGANSLWRYDGTAAGTLKPRVLVFGNKWGTGRNVFVGVGDLNRDGKADLVSRNAAGDLLRNSGTGAGSFSSTVKIGTGWQGYKGLF
ncbi:FG-GAP-like repeat-containing protein [Streptomyces wuyuanensis]|uniref:FG-GAP-like repeat-containing protein n=1 Tax=Streptomyces wuyuanensis TaxID=1196353 RepID=UPI00380FDAA9